MSQMETMQRVAKYAAQKPSQYIKLLPIPF